MCGVCILHRRYYKNDQAWKNESRRGYDVTPSTTTKWSLLLITKGHCCC